MTCLMCTDYGLISQDLVMQERWLCKKGELYGWYVMATDVDQAYYGWSHDELPDSDRVDSQVVIDVSFGISFKFSCFCR